jgi:hypothetical protein
MNLIQPYVLEISKAAKPASHHQIPRNSRPGSPHFDGNDIPQYGKNNLWFL